MFLDQRFAHTNVSLESAGSTPAILVVLVVMPVCSMWPRTSMSAGVDNNSDNIISDAAQYSIVME